MEHTKTHHMKTLETINGKITIEGPLSAEQLECYHFHEYLTTFRPAKKQFKSILKIANFNEGRMIIARTSDTIIGYVTFLYPDPMERWSIFEMNNLMMLGAIEVIPQYRECKIASELLKLSMEDPFMENYIIISTEYYWHWDLRKTGLSMWDYRKVMEKMMAKGDLLPARTDDPEISSHPANCLMVRIGSNVSKESIEKFENLRFLRRYKQRTLKEDL